MRPKTFKILLALALLTTVVASMHAQTYSVDWFKVAGGGGTSTGGVYTVSGTFGQQDAGGSLNGSGYSVTLGFWSLLGQAAPALIPTVPVITSQPQSQFVYNGRPAAFNVSVSGTSPLFYQWQKNGVNLTDGGDISGSATANLALNPTSTNDAGSYKVVIRNNYGNVTNSSTAKLTLWMLWTYSVTDLGTLGGTLSIANGINNSGQVVGDSYTAGNAADHAFLYSGGSMSDLGTLGGSDRYAYGINNSGQVVGYADTAGNAADHAFLYSGGTMSDLGALGGTYSGAYGINNSGQVVGYAGTAANAAEHAFLSSGGTMSDLGALGGTYSVAIGINNSGQVVGYADTGGGLEHAFLYSGGTMSDLGTLGGTYSQAYGINNSGQVVGYADTAAVAHAFLYSGGTMSDLNNLVNTNILGTILYTAQGINDSAQIIANGNNNHAYLLSPHPPNLDAAVQSRSANGGNFQFSWNSLNTYPAVGYQVQYTTNLIAPNWLNLGGVLTGSTVSAIDTISTNRQRFYRVLLVQ